MVMNGSICRDCPRALDLLLTKDCNLDCIMCVRVREEKGTLPVEAFDRLSPLMPALRNISWQGGEVFLVPYFMEVLTRICSEYPAIKHGIITNGQCLSREFCHAVSHG